MKILISGTTGFVAPRLARKLVKLGHDVWGLERYVTGRTNYSRDEPFNRCFADLNDMHAVRCLISKLQPEVVFHLAALSPVALSYEQPEIVNKTNYLATINLAEACMKLVSHFKHFVFAGTSEEYGNQKNFPIREDAPLHPNSPYAVSKVAANLYLEYMRDAYGFPITICRPFNTYGRVGTTHFVTERIIVQMIKNAKTVKMGDPEPVRDMVYVIDHVDGYLAVLEHPEKSIGEAFNFCTGRGYTIRELVTIIARLTGWEGNLRWHTIPRRPLDIQTLIGNNNKAANLLSWKPKYSLSEGLDLTIRELRKLNG